MKVRLKSSIAWKGQDFDGADLMVQPGGEFELSEERANMLMLDYPGRFAISGTETPARIVATEEAFHTEEEKPTPPPSPRPRPSARGRRRASR